MDATAAVALYGAVLSTGIAAGQLWQWHRVNKTVLRVEIEAGEASPILISVESKSYTVLWINVINEGEQPEQVAWVWVQRLDRDLGWVEDSGVGGEDIIAPRGRKTYIAAEEPVAAQEEADFHVSEIRAPYRVRVLSGRGEDFYSDMYCVSE